MIASRAGVVGVVGRRLMAVPGLERLGQRRWLGRRRREAVVARGVTVGGGRGGGG